MKQFSELTEEEKQSYLDLAVCLMKMFLSRNYTDNQFNLSLSESCAKKIYDFEQSKISETNISLSDSLGKDEMYCDWYECTKCKDKNVIVYSKFCSNCGVKLNWIS